MRGGVFHEYMIAVLEDLFQKRGLRTRRQVPSRKGRATGYIDLLVYGNDLEFLIIEVEMDKKRAVNDIRKRDDLGENAMLWIVTPTQKLTQKIRKHLRTLGIEDDDQICVLPFGAAVKRVLTKNPFCFGA